MITRDMTPGTPNKEQIYTVDPLTGKINYKLIFILMGIISLPIWVGIGLLLYNSGVLSSILGG